MFRATLKKEKTTSEDQSLKQNTAMLSFLRSIGIDPPKIEAEFAQAKDWLIKGLTHFKLRFDTLEALNRQAVEDTAKYHARLDEIEHSMVESHRHATAVLLELRDILRQAQGLPPDQIWDEKSLDGVKEALKASAAPPHA